MRASSSSREIARASTSCSLKLLKERMGEHSPKLRRCLILRRTVPASKGKGELRAGGVRPILGVGRAAALLPGLSLGGCFQHGADILGRHAALEHVLFEGGVNLRAPH